VVDREAIALLDLSMVLAVSRSGSESVRWTGETFKGVGVSTSFTLRRYCLLD
jgi:hypothetical protein